ncbi:alpha/beta fold hydrolase [Mycobacterium conspicuum]|uniref:Peroxidase n=1 Tax=Mycobacterium conspicuum TaxID=44010 RepID=A0A1X1THP2_9MYCO|nr:alpha/beta hydrolase [Mycobacterium conspicuum]ORV44082.1 alpha/beta hydrolase [Mycobacterium conspicuum]BBZ39412.1 peroxidase [Mycobacterium conspicuum]
MTSYESVRSSTALGANGISYRYRRVGNPAARPLVLLQHFRGNLDNWDPALLDALAGSREVVAFDNVGVGGSTGRVPPSVTQMAHDAISFITAVGLDRVDILGYSLGGFVAQEITLIRPDLVERMVLAATAPQGAPGMHGWVGDIIDAVGSEHTTGDQLLHAFFTDSAASRAAGGEFLGRIFARAEGRDEATDWATRQAHYDAVVQWGVPNHSMLERLAAISQPVLVANGDSDRMILPRYSHLSVSLLPNATIKIYPDAAHGFLFQHHSAFADDVCGFLDT